MCTPYYDSEVIKNLFFLQELYENDSDSDILSNYENNPFNNFEGRKHKNDYINHNRIFKEIFTQPLQTEENYVTSLIINNLKEGTDQTSKYENKENNQTPQDIHTELLFKTNGKESQSKQKSEIVKKNSVQTTPLNEKNINYLFTKIKNIFVNKNFPENIITLFKNNKDNIISNMTKGISLFEVKNQELNKRNRNNQNKVEKKEKIKKGRKKKKIKMKENIRKIALIILLRKLRLYFLIV